MISVQVHVVKGLGSLKSGRSNTPHRPNPEAGRTCKGVLLVAWLEPAPSR